MTNPSIYRYSQVFAVDVDPATATMQRTIYKPSAAKRLGLDVREVHEDDFEVLKSFGEIYPYAKLYLYLFENIAEEFGKRWIQRES